jgi:DNA topoisomerase II
MIIDGTLVISKKKKAVLVEELRRLKFKPFPKVADARKAGELMDAQEDEDEEAENDAVGASDYDYLLGVSS